MHADSAKRTDVCALPFALTPIKRQLAVRMGIIHLRTTTSNKRLLKSVSNRRWLKSAS